MVKLSKFFIVGIAAIAAFGVKACSVATVKTAPLIVAGTTSIPKGKLARAAAVNEAGVFDGMFGETDDEESAAGSAGVPLPPTAYLPSTEIGANPEVSVPAPAINVPTYSIPQVPIGESDAERSMRMMRDAEMRAHENMMRQQQQIQQMQAEQWRLQQQLHNSAGYSRNW